jgi:hypothetical protein
MLNLFSRYVSAPDVDATKVPAWVVTGAAWVTVGAVCDQANGSVSFRMVFTDLAGNLTACSPPQVYTSGTGAADFAGKWIGTPAQWAGNNTCNDLLTLKVDAIIGNWTFFLQGFTPPVLPAA